MNGFTNEQYFKALWENSPVPVAFVSTDNKFTAVNKALCEFVGYTESELLQKTWVQITHPEDVDGDQSEVDKILRGESEGYGDQKRYIRKDGVIKWLNLQVRVIRNSSGSVDHFVSWILPMPNGGHFKVEKKENQIQVRPSVKWLDFFKDNWKFCTVVSFIFLLSLAEKLKETVEWFFSLMQ